MQERLSNTILAYNQLLLECEELARSMRFNPDYVIGKVMPKKTTDRRDTGRIEKWFDSVKGNALQWIQEAEKAREERRNREELLASLNLTPEQKALLGIQ